MTTTATPDRIITDDHAFLTSRTATQGESSPLLSPTTPDINADDDRKQAAGPVPHIHYKRIAALFMASVCLIEMSAIILQAPANALMEDVICRSKLSLPPPTSTSSPLTLTDDPRCKTPDVQGELAMMRGWQTALDTLPSIICAVPYAMLADRVGRRPVLILAFLGFVLAIFWQAGVLLLSTRGVVPLWTIYLASLWTFIGAFSCTGPAMLFTILGDVCPPAERAAVFFRVSVAFIVGELIGSPLAGALMKLGGPWLPIGLSLVGSAMSFSLTLFVPETLEKRADDDDDDDSRGKQQRGPTALRSAVGAAASSFRELWAFTVAHTNLLSLMIPMALFVLGRMVQDALLQYATKRYGISWSSASMLVAARTAANLVLFVVVFPYISHVLTETSRMSTPAKDLLMARWTGVIGAAGAFLVALSSTPALFALALAVFSVGTGFSTVLRSLLNTLVEQRHLAMVNSLVSFLELLGTFVAGPVLSKALSVGIELGGAWVGLPFFAAGCSLSLSAGMVWIYRLPKAARDGRGGADEALVGGGGAHRC
ncbi:hypothetical protein PspLS_08250 [Pyricularia sp. CBS 133598]|nr:hypothetical protein PspLS_08250 [Pyricularia sp. CBS 133598]